MAKGNDPARWEKLLAALDEKLQLGLLNYLQRVAVYHFEGEELLLEPGSPEDEEYLRRDSVLQQLALLAQDAVKIEKIRIRS